MLTLRTTGDLAPWTRWAPAALLVAGILLTLSILIAPGGSVLAKVWPAGPILWLLGALGLLGRLALAPRQGSAWKPLAAIVALAAPWTLMGGGYTYNILRQGLPFDIAHLVLPPALLVTGVALWAALRVLRRAPA